MPRDGRRIKGDADERTQARDRLRDELLTATRALATEKGGYEQVTIRAVAERVGYAAPVVYQYFANKHALLLALVDIGFAELADRMANTDRQLHAVGLAYWDFGFAEPALYRLMHSLADVPFGTPDAPPAARDCFVLLKSVVDQVAPANPAAGHDPNAATDLVWAHLHGLVSLSLDGRIMGGPARGRDLVRYVAEVAIGTERN